MKIEEIIEGCKKRKPKAQKALYDMFSPKCFGICLRYCRSREDAEDVFQDSFAKVFENIDKYSYSGSFEGWINRIFINHALNYYRKSNLSSYSVELKEEMLDNNIQETSEDFMSDYSTEEIVSAISQLPTMRRLIFNLVEVEDTSYENVAQMLSVSQECVRSQNCKAKRNLRDILLNSKKNV